LKIFKKSAISAFVVGVAITGSVVACSSASSPAPVNQASAAASKEAAAQGADSNNLQTNQPTPIYQYSQERETLINVEDIEANGENTTTFGISNDGSLVWECSSIGMPVAADDELTNPDQQESQPDGGGYQENPGDNVLPQEDPTGVYTGDTTGTNTLCVDNQGKEYIQYWEGYTDAVSGDATYNNTTHTVQLLGSPDPIKVIKG
jgi:hypothetical protein